VLIEYATQESHAAWEGSKEEHNGVFTKAILKHIHTPGQRLYGWDGTRVFLCLCVCACVCVCVCGCACVSHVLHRFYYW